MFQFVFLALARVYLNLLYVTEIQDHGETLTVRFNDKREPLTVSGEDVETIRSAFRPPGNDEPSKDQEDDPPAEDQDDQTPGDGDHAGDQAAEIAEEPPGDSEAVVTGSGDEEKSPTDAHA